MESHAAGVSVRNCQLRFESRIRRRVSTRSLATFPRHADFCANDSDVSRQVVTQKMLEPRQSRHPERSASQIYRKRRTLWRGVEGPRQCLLADAIGSFPAANYDWTIKKSPTPSEPE